MDYLFDGDPIHAGDRLWDWNEGIVEVKDVFNDGILVTKNVKNRSSQVIQYGFDGVPARGRIKTLFWQQPVIVTPRKNALLWTAQCKIIRTLINEFGQFVTSATPLPEYDTTTMSIQDAMSRGMITGAEAKQLIADQRKGKR
jgi:hypothetical protein